MDQDRTSGSCGSVESLEKCRASAALRTV